MLELRSSGTVVSLTQCWVDHQLSWVRVARWVVCCLLRAKGGCSQCSDDATVAEREAAKRWLAMLRCEFAFA